MAVSEFVLRKINSSVWFVQTFLRKMLYIAKPPNFPYTSSAVNMWKMNQFHTHSQKKQNPAKKYIKSGQIERRRKRERRLGSIGGGEGGIVRWRRDRAALESDWCDRRSGVIVGLVRSLDWCNRQSSAFSSLLSLSVSLLRSSDWCDIGDLLSLSLSSIFQGRKSFEVKMKTEIIFVVLAIFFGQLEMLFSLTKFEVTTKHPLFRKIISGISLKSKQTKP